MSHPRRRIRRRALPLLAVGGAALLSLPAVATSTPITPTVECVVPDGAGNLIAYFGYTNPYGATTVPIASTGDRLNHFTTGPADRGQPTSFLPGRRAAAFTTSFPAGETLTWRLKNLTTYPAETATASTETRRCLPNLVLDITGPATGAPGQTGTWVVTVRHAGYPEIGGAPQPDVGIPVSAISTTLDGGRPLTPDTASVPAGGLLKPGQSLTYTITSPFPCTPGPSTKSATTGLTSGEETTTADNTDSTATTVTAGTCAVDLGIGITPNPTTTAPGQTVTWTVPVTNAGPTPVRIEDIRVIAPGLPNLTPAPGTPTTGTLAPGSSITFIATTPITPVQCGTLTNVVRVGYGTDTTPESERDNNPVNDTAIGSVVVVCGAPTPTPPTVPPAPPVTPDGGGTVCVAPRLSATVSGPRRVVAGQLTTVTLVARNRSNRVAATSTRLRYTVPAGFSLAQVPRGASLRNGLLTVQIGRLATGADRTVRLSLRVNRTATRDITHRTRLTAACSASATGALGTQVTPIDDPNQPNVTG